MTGISYLVKRFGNVVSRGFVKRLGQWCTTGFKTVLRSRAEDLEMEVPTANSIAAPRNLSYEDDGSCNFLQFRVWVRRPGSLGSVATAPTS